VNVITTAQSSLSAAQVSIADALNAIESSRIDLSLKKRVRALVAPLHSLQLFLLEELGEQEVN
jgi:hypothetical protein